MLCLQIFEQKKMKNFFNVCEKKYIYIYTYTFLFLTKPELET